MYAPAEELFPFEDFLPELLSSDGAAAGDIFSGAGDFDYPLFNVNLIVHEDQTEGIGIPVDKKPSQPAIRSEVLAGVKDCPTAPQVPQVRLLPERRDNMEERQRKISRYIKKRKRRNFARTIKYKCRKVLADSQPRVRGRFAKVS